MEADDPFDSLLKHRQPYSTQGAKSTSRSVDPDSEILPDGDDSSPEPMEMEQTEIVIVSLPDSQNDQSSPREFMTPPDQSQPLSSSEEQNRPAVTLSDVGDDRRLNGGEGNLVGDAMLVDSVVKYSNVEGISGLKFGRTVDDGGSEESKLVLEDLLDILKRRGVSFPRPRWWPAKGFDN